ncbi:hypothetical protein [Lentzea albidocapillata]|uniref:hypothetical protein n=1 Tax=Lentzea albidocapillata TaxID=40571 RepID=UPI00115F7975|nr:hypothetical protein [Lentzea albidocapillata]
MHDYKIVRVSEQGFGLFDRGEVPMIPGHFTNGLLRPLPFGALVYTGVSVGTVNVAAKSLVDRPDLAEVANWDDAVEVSVRSEYGQLNVESYEDGPVDGLPLLSARGPGWYRIRAHVRHRDRYYDAINADGAENYLLLSWPEGNPSSEVVLRATDMCGRQLRLTSAYTPEAVSQTPPMARDETRERTHQALLDAQKLAPDPESQ